MADIKKTILIIGDSLAGDRSDMDGLLIESRWPYLLSKLVEDSYHTVNRAIPASTSKRLISQKDSDADLNIIQLGIVDCVPRYFTKFESRILSKIPNRFRIVLIEYLKSKRHQTIKRAYVNKDEYRYNFEAFLNNIKGETIIIKILVPQTKYLQSNSGALNAVKEYNNIIDSIVSTRDSVKVASIPTELVNILTLEDGYHLNKDGHIYLSELLKIIIQ